VTFAGVDPPYNIALVTSNHVFSDVGSRKAIACINDVGSAA
jgi:hypothetical protein